MVEISRKNQSTYREAGKLLAAALQQRHEIDTARATCRNAQLESASERARDAVDQIRNAMRSGNLNASSVAALWAALNIGVDASALAAEAAHESGAVAAQVQLAAVSLESHKTVKRIAADLFDRHEFDADVARHTHGAELEAFKRREAADEKYIKEQLARGMPEGDLNASGRMQGYMLDANAHGASDNPNFRKIWDELEKKTKKLHKSMHAAGQSTEEYDKHIREDVVTLLKAKGLSDAQIKEALAKNEDPLDAVKPYLGSDDESRHLANDIGASAKSQEPKSPAPVSNGVRPDNQPLWIDPEAIDAKLAAAGLSTTGKSESNAHGLTIQKPGKAPDTIVR
jgi:hypothetical protein